MTYYSISPLKKAQEIANSNPGFHADGCPYLIYRGNRDCKCGIYDSALRNVLKEREEEKKDDINHRKR